MTETPADQPTAAALAAAAGVAELAAAAEADGPDSDGLLAALVRHEVALGHRLTMQFAAAGNAALDVAFGHAADAAAAKAADRQAARLGAAAARVMGNVRLTLRALDGRPATAAEGQFIGVRFEDEPACSPAEAERRLAAARAAAAGRGDAGPAAAVAAAPAEFAAALAAATQLAAEAGIAELAPATAAGLLRHEVAAAHRLAMRCGGRACRLLDQAEPEDDKTEALRLASASARLMLRGRQALAALPQLGPAPAGGPGGGSRRVAGYYWLGERNLLANSNTPADTDGCGRPAAAAGSRVSAPATGRQQGAAPTSEPALRRGRLRHGNPSGDYLAAPRCGARTRAGCACCQPAMANGRCRFHGGKSTGPRTEAGLARSRAARRTHGGYSAEIIDLCEAAAAHARRVAALRARFAAPASEDRRQKAARAGKPAAPAALIVPPAAVFGRRPSTPHAPVLAGHGVHPLFFMARRADLPSPAEAGFAKAGAPLRREGGSGK
jgi:hypothetical protein